MFLLTEAPQGIWVNMRSYGLSDNMRERREDARNRFCRCIIIGTELVSYLASRKHITRHKPLAKGAQRGFDIRSGRHSGGLALPNEADSPLEFRQVYI